MRHPGPKDEEYQGRNNAMPIFTSKRERHLWLWAFLIVLTIYSTLGLAGRLTEPLRERNLLNGLFFVGFTLIVAAIIANGWRKHTRQREIWMALGIVAVYGMAMVRVFVSPEERTHLIEYGIVAVLIYEALIERDRNGRRVSIPAIRAMVVIAVLGLLDEGIQGLLPNRIFDIRDIGFNALAGIMAIASTVVLTWARQRKGK
jgi:drug/metabolite transporter (DMT)-like permease